MFALLRYLKCDIVLNAGYYGLSYDSIKALGRLHVVHFKDFLSSLKMKSPNFFIFALSFSVLNVFASAVRTPVVQCNMLLPCPAGQEICKLECDCCRTSFRFHILPIYNQI